MRNDSHSITQKLSPANDKPLFEQLRNQLRDDILGLRLKPGQKLPSEARLQENFGVSRITVRQALSALQSEGLIQTINGKGSFVTRPANAPRLGMMTGFFDYMRTRGKSAYGQTLSIRNTKSTKLVSDALKLPAETIVTTFTTLRRVNNTPVVVGRIVMEPAIAHRLLDDDIENDDVMTLLETRLEFRLESNHIEASAVRAGKVRAAQLDVEPDSPLLRMRFVPYDISGKPLIFSEMFFIPEKFSYRAVVRR